MAPETMAIDLDGTITPFPLYNPKIKLPWFFFFFYIPLVLVARPKKAVVGYLNNIIAQGGKVIIVTARPVQMANLTKILLVTYRVPFTELFCVGGGQEANIRKLDIIVKNKAKLFVDNDKYMTKFCRQNSIPIVSVAELLTPSD